MSFLNKTNTPLITSKLTAIGRQKLASGQLNFKYYAFGDSQVDYAASTGQSLEILKPKDFQPNIKTFITKSDCNPFNTLDGVKVIECCLHNQAKQRGFFASSGGTLSVSTDYIKQKGIVQSTLFNGSNFIDIQTTNFDNGDFILFKLNNDTTGYLAEAETIAPVPYLIYQITKNSTSTVIETDRPLPYLTFTGATAINYYVIDKDVAYYSTTNADVLWDYENMQFKIECLQEDTLIWNFNIVWNENLIGTQTNQQQYYDYCCYSYVGQKEYLGLNKDCPDVTASGNCEDKLLGVDDDFVKGIGILHYSNTNKNNLYGEYFYIASSGDITINLPTIMWHRRDFGGSAVGDEIGMRFVNDITKKTLPNTNIEYYELIEDISYLSSGDTAFSVGRIYPQLQVVVIHDQELLAALSYKSNRNFTLPKLSGKMISSNSTGVLPKGKTMYLTYTFQSDNNIQHILPQQKYLKFVNNTNSAKDVEFYLEKTGYLPYMRQIESVGYDGYGFSFHRFKILFQIVDTNERPKSELWQTIDYTNNYITNLVGNTINPLNLENQSPQLTGFFVNNANYITASGYSLNVLQIPDESCPEKLGFGCENLFFGNIDVEIGACVYKSIFELSLDSDIFNKTTNPTWNTNQNLHLTEIGIYDNEYNLVWHNAFYENVEITDNSNTLIEVQIDF